jgi:hypothetical protein
MTAPRPIIEHEYSGISVPWLLGDEGELADYNQEKPSIVGQFHPQLARLFLEYIQIGLTERQACLEVPMNERWPRSWGRGSMGAPLAFVDALENYAKPLQYDMMANDVVDISDGTDALTNEKAIIESIYNPLRGALHKTNRKSVKEYRAMVGDRVAARKWYVGKMRPSKYGDKFQLDHGNTGGTPLKVVDYSKLSTEQLEALAKIDEALAEDGTE